MSMSDSCFVVVFIYFENDDGLLWRWSQLTSGFPGKMANAGMVRTMCFLTNTPYLPKISTISTYIRKGIPLSMYPLILTYSSVILFYEIRVFIHETENIAH